MKVVILPATVVAWPLASLEEVTAPDTRCLLATTPKSRVPDGFARCFREVGAKPPFLAAKLRHYRRLLFRRPKPELPRGF